MSYLDPLPPKVSLQVFNDDTLIFESSGKWLHPLFELENFLKSYTGPVNNLSTHDTAIGKAAAVLTYRLGVKRINAELLSQNALNFINFVNEKSEPQLQIKWTNLIPKLMCATENQLEDLFDVDEIYFLLRQRAKKIQGIEVSVKNLNHPYCQKKNLSFEMNAGNHLMIVGENGAGKTTLLKMLAGISKPESGEILIGGKSPAELKKFTIGYIPQFTDNTNFSLSVEEVVSLGIEKSHNSEKTSEKIKKALIRTSSLHLAKRSFNSLSGGEKQKVQLSRCLAQNAQLLLLDEPTASLDAENKKMVTDILRSLTISEIPTIIVVTHDKELSQLKGWEVLNV